MEESRILVPGDTLNLSHSALYWVSSAVASPAKNTAWSAPETPFGRLGFTNYSSLAQVHMQKSNGGI